MSAYQPTVTEVVVRSDEDVGSLIHKDTTSVEGLKSLEQQVPHDLRHEPDDTDCHSDEGNLLYDPCFDRLNPGEVSDGEEGDAVQRNDRMLSFGSKCVQTNHQVH